MPEHQRELIDAASASDHLIPPIAAPGPRGKQDWAEDLADDRATADVKLKTLCEQLDAEMLGEFEE